MWGSEARARRRRAQEMERRLQELDRIDALYGLGTMPDQVPQPRRRQSILPLILVGAICWWGLSSGYLEGLVMSVRSTLGMDAEVMSWGDSDQHMKRAIASPAPNEPVGSVGDAPRLQAAAGDSALETGLNLDPPIGSDGPGIQSG